jgi:putative tryptophan/tyrosine transport system substrate-binding protein
MKRREFIAGLGATAWPLAARAQQAALPVVGWLGSESAEQFADRVRAFRLGLNDSGYVEGRNVAVEYLYANGHYDQISVLATELVRQRVAVIASIGAVRGVLAAKAATTTIPIVFQLGADPVAAGIVASLNRPGGNLTGVSNLNAELLPKRLELLHEMIPAATVIALVVNPTNPIVAEANKRDLEAAARILGLHLQVLHASTENDFDAVFAKLTEHHVGGLVISGDAFFTSRSEQLAALSLQHAIPTIYQFHNFVAAGGLMSYGGSLSEANRQAGRYVGRILKGEKPADLPVQQTTKVELIINLKTAKALGLTIPETLLATADEVIQ